MKAVAKTPHGRGRVSPSRLQHHPWTFWFVWYENHQVSRLKMYPEAIPSALPRCAAQAFPNKTRLSPQLRVAVLLFIHRSFNG